MLHLLPFNFMEDLLRSLCFALAVFQNWKNGGNSKKYFVHVVAHVFFVVRKLETDKNSLWSAVLVGCGAADDALVGSGAADEALVYLVFAMVSFSASIGKYNECDRCDVTT